MFVFEQFGRSNPWRDRVKPAGSGSHQPYLLKGEEEQTARLK